METQRKPKRLTFIGIALVVVTVVIVLAVFSMGFNGLESNGISSGGSTGSTIMKLQKDYNSWEGDFKSFDEGDKIALRDRVTSIKLLEDPITGKPVTALYFKAYTLPSIDDLRAGRVEEGSWYLWNAEQDPAHASSGCYSIFNMKYSPQTRPANYVHDEVPICVVGDLTNIVKVGDIVEMPLYIVKGLVYDPYSSGHIWVEAIREFKVCVRTEDFRKIS